MLDYITDRIDFQVIFRENKISIEISFSINRFGEGDFEHRTVLL